MVQPDQLAPPAPPGVSVILSGFGSFAGVANNPSKHLVSYLEQQYAVGSAGADLSAPERRSLRNGRIVSCTILKASARAVNSYLVRQLEDLKQQGAALARSGSGSDGNGQPTVVLLLHFGADVQRPWFNLEARAVNNATFRSPDEDGWQPDCCPIASIPGMPLDCSVSSDLDLARLHRHLRARGHDVKLSSDAGRFVCNWTYYNSLALCKEAMAVAAAAAAAAAEAFGGRSSSPSSNSSSGSGGGGGNCSRSASGCDSVGEAWCSGGCSPRASLPASPLGRTGSGFGEAPRAPGANPFSSGPGGSSRASGKGCSGAGGGLIVHSLFVHVPSFDSIGQARQQRFAVDLLELLCDQLHERYFGRRGGSGASGGSSECGVLSGDRYRHRHHHHAHGSHGHVYGHGHNFSGGLQLYAAVGSDCGSSCSSTSSGGGGNGSYFSHQLTRQGFGHKRSPATGMSNSATLQQQQHQQQLLLLSQQLFLMHQQAAAAPQLQYPQQQMHHHHYHQHQHHQQPQLLELHLQQERQWLAGALLPQLQTMASDYEQPLASGRQQVLLA